MVLSPIDPVAPRTVTVRTADAAALLLRNGTALISSPNHKTTADAIQPASQEAEYASQDDRRNKAVQSIEQPAMSGNQMARVLDPEAPLHRGFQEAAQLGHH